MPIYCLECKHFSFYKPKASHGDWVCAHPSNVSDEAKDDWLYSRTEQEFTVAASVKNASKDCSDFEEALT